MAGKGQLARRREDAHAIVGAGHSRLEKKCGLSQICPFGEGGHGRVGKFVGIDDDGEGISLERQVAENVYLMEGKRAHRIWFSLWNL
jgi:hypothetical protein